MNSATGAASALTAIFVATAPTLALAQTPPPRAVVHIANFTFAPRTLTVEPGQPVRFVNDDNEPHTATAVDKSFDSGGLDQHNAFEHAFSKPGTYAYFCEMHPYMKGTIVVKARAAKP
jgi:plastocyanin